MGLRISNLHAQWQSFVDSYDRINNTCEKLFRVELTAEEREADLDSFAKLRGILKEN